MPQFVQRDRYRQAHDKQDNPDDVRDHIHPDNATAAILSIRPEHRHRRGAVAGIWG